MKLTRRDFIKANAAAAAATVAGITLPVSQEAQAQVRGADGIREGTLGVVTQATLKLRPIPEHFSAVVEAFENVAGATRSVSAIMGAGLGKDVALMTDGRFSGGRVMASSSGTSPRKRRKVAPSPWCKMATKSRLMPKRAPSAWP